MDNSIDARLCALEKWANDVDGQIDRLQQYVAGCESKLSTLTQVTNDLNARLSALETDAVRFGSSVSIQQGDGNGHTWAISSSMPDPYAPQAQKISIDECSSLSGPSAWKINWQINRSQ